MGGPGKFPHRYQAGKEQFESEFRCLVVESRHALRDPAWLADHPEARAQDLMEAFADTTIRGIISTIGGDDSVRLLPHLDLEVIRRNPKVFLGYSDSTVTHLACRRAGLVSFYGPSYMSGFGENSGMFPYMIESVRRTLFSAEPIGVIEPNRDGWTVEHLPWEEPAHQERRRRLNPSTGWRVLQGAGTATGHLLGGCMDVLEFLKGTEWWPPPEDWEGALLFLETSEDAPPPQWVKWWLRNHGSQGILQRLAGLLVGRPGGQVPEPAFEDYDAAVLRVVRDELGLGSLPIITRMDFGHTDPMFVLPQQMWTAESDLDGNGWSARQRTFGDYPFHSGFKEFQVVGGRTFVSGCAWRDRFFDLRPMFGAAGGNLIAKGHAMGLGLTEDGVLRAFVNLGQEYLHRGQTLADALPTAAETVADEAWHTYGLRLEGKALSVLVDGETRSTAIAAAAHGGAVGDRRGIPRAHRPRESSYRSDMTRPASLVRADLLDRELAAHEPKSS